MKKVLILLCIATMLFYTGVTAKPSEKQTSEYQVSKTDVPVFEMATPTTPMLLVALPEYPFSQCDIYYVETITYCDYYQESVNELIWSEVETPPPNICISFIS